MHDGHDWLYVLDGRLRLLLGDDDLIIEPGEAVEFYDHAALVRRGRRPGRARSAIFGPHGERLHLEH